MAHTARPAPAADRESARETSQAGNSYRAIAAGEDQAPAGGSHSAGIRAAIRGVDSALSSKLLRRPFCVAAQGVLRGLGLACGPSTSLRDAAYPRRPLSLSL